MGLVLLLFLLLIAGIGYVLYVVARILFGMLCGFVQLPDVDVLTGDVEPRSTGTQSTFVPGFRKIHFYIFLAFDLAYSSLAYLAISPGDWNSWDSHGIVTRILAYCSPFRARSAQRYLSLAPSIGKPPGCFFPFVPCSFYGEFSVS
jgi:hypothetical protein